MHSIRLRGPWQCLESTLASDSQADPKIHFARKFNCPTGLTSDQQIRIQVTALPAARNADFILRLNSTEFELTPADDTNSPESVAAHNGLTRHATVTGCLEAHNTLELISMWASREALLEALPQSSDTDTTGWPQFAELFSVELQIN